jgi:hypothetical protein
VQLLVYGLSARHLHDHSRKMDALPLEESNEFEPDPPSGALQHHAISAAIVPTNPCWLDEKCVGKSDVVNNIYVEAWAEGRTVHIVCSTIGHRVLDSRTKSNETWEQCRITAPLLQGNICVFHVWACVSTPQRCAVL